MTLITELAQDLEFIMPYTYLPPENQKPSEYLLNGKADKSRYNHEKRGGGNLSKRKSAHSDVWG